MPDPEILGGELAKEFEAAAAEAGISPNAVQHIDADQDVTEFLEGVES